VIIKAMQNMAQLTSTFTVHEITGRQNLSGKIDSESFCLLALY